MRPKRGQRAPLVAGAGRTGGRACGTCCWVRSVVAHVAVLWASGRTAVLAVRAGTPVAHIVGFASFGRSRGVMWGARADSMSARCVLRMTGGTPRLFGAEHGYGINV